MDHEILKRVIMEQRETIQRSVLVKREYEFEPNANYILTGLRRAGKSSLLFALVKQLIQQGATWDQMIYVNFEDERLVEFTLKDFSDLVETVNELSSKKPYYFLDEVQNVEGWERFARRMADQKERVYITGSNARMLGAEMEARLGGRYLSKTIMPYNFREYLTARNIPFDETALYTAKRIGRLRNAADDFMHDGGFPESLQFLDKRAYGESIYQKVLLGDIALRNEIRKTTGLRILMKKIAETVCQGVSYTKLKNVVNEIGIQLSKDSVISYVNYAKEAYLLFFVQNYFAKFNEKASAPKFYFADNGLLNLLLMDKDSALLENAVATALKRSFQDNFYYLKSAKTGVDIDFYVPERNLAIQVAYRLSDYDTYEREMNQFRKLSRSFSDAKRFFIVTMGEEKKIQEEGFEIEVLPLYRFLLEF